MTTPTWAWVAWLTICAAALTLFIFPVWFEYYRRGR